MSTSTRLEGPGARRRLELALALLAVALVAALPPSAHAGIVTVTAYTDGVANPANCPGAGCRLRDAIAAANPGDTITFSSAGHTIPLTQGELNIAKNLTIVWNGDVGDIVIDAQSSSRIVNIASGVTAVLDTLDLVNGKPPSGFNGGAIRVASTATLNLNNIRIESSQVQGSGDVGGAIYNLGTLNITGTAYFTGNQTAANGQGGVIYNAGIANLTGYLNGHDVRSIEFFGNSANLEGGTIYNDGTLTATFILISSSTAKTGGGIYNHATLAIDKSVVAGNNANGTAVNQGEGGGIYNSDTGTLTITDSLIATNNAARAGAGIASVGALTIQRSLINGNSLNAGGIIGGGIVNAGTMTMTNSTVSTNAAPLDGGGMFNSLGSAADLNNVTITKNTADSDNDGNGNGGGIYNGCASGMLCAVQPMTVTVRNTIIAGNFDTPNNAGPGPIQPDCHGPTLSEGYNLLRVDTGCSGLTDGVNGDQVGTSSSPLNANLGPLADNGGPTQTHALLPGSPAINAGNPLTPGSGGLACARLDQRGFLRVGRCDIGAYERVFLNLLPLMVKQ